MANSVSTQVNITFNTEAGALEFVNQINPNGNLDEVINQHIIPGLDYDRDEWISAVGAKWCNVHDISQFDSQVSISLESAWSFPEELIITMLVAARKIEGFETLYANYQDEGYGFIGVWGANADNIQSEEAEYDDLLSGFRTESGYDDTEDYYFEWIEFIDEFMFPQLREVVEDNLA